MTYYNPVLRYGVDAFARDLAAAGGLGVITPDLIPDEADEWLAASDRPTGWTGSSWSRRRPPRSASRPRRPPPAAFLYATSTMGVTGARDAVAAAAPQIVARCRAHTALPIGVGPRGAVGATRPPRWRPSPTA